MERPKALSRTVGEMMNAIVEWAERDSYIHALILAGSYARGTNKDTSDIDLCIITTRKVGMVEKPDFMEVFGRVRKNQIEYYGACTSVRAWYEEGQEVEFAMVEPSWISVPLDRGTRKVLNDGYIVLVDKEGYFTNLNIR
ncbi:MAG TPA: aminoglycoside 6-adenylyltransferase [Candidatus Pelethocola excrementipullorum]|nr:aminoglycoside 6-adenylyltransferase [Candidatus Pelethocola excrementipullorum]